MISLRTGDICGADVCLLNGHLSVDASALTGESVLKSMSRESIVFAGSIIKRGEANALVVAIGENTYFGKTAQLVQASAPNPHIQRILTRIVGLLMTLILILIVVTLIVMAIRHDDMVKAVPLLLMVVITALPVALPASQIQHLCAHMHSLSHMNQCAFMFHPANHSCPDCSFIQHFCLYSVFTVSMALGSKELSTRGVLVTRLNVLEDCALMSILFSDKTGTSVINMHTHR
jgi:H+-transporting ATPase